MIKKINKTKHHDKKKIRKHHDTGSRKKLGHL